MVFNIGREGDTGDLLKLKTICMALRLFTVTDNAQ